MIMINWFYRSEALKATTAAIEKYPALTLKTEHPSLVLFRRECQNDNHPSVILLNDHAHLTELIAEVMAGRSYSEIAVDQFGDDYSTDDVKAILNRSEYAFKGGFGMGEESYVIKGKFDDLDFDEIVKRRQKELDDAEDAKNVGAVAAGIAKLLSVEQEMALRIVKYGIQSAGAFQGITTDDLTIGGQFGLDEAEFIIARAKEANIL